MSKLQPDHNSFGNPEFGNPYGHCNEITSTFGRRNLFGGNPVWQLGGNPFGLWKDDVRHDKFTKIVPRQKATIPPGALVKLNPRLLK